MRTRGKVFLVLAIVCLIATLVVAEEEKADMDMDMSKFGIPQEIKDCAYMVGDWHYVGQMRMGPEAEWIDHEAEATFDLVAGGAALEMTYTGDMMGMMMHGLSISTFNKETKIWTDIWIDNFMGRMSTYTGTDKDGKRVMTGKDEMDGKVMYSRMTSYDQTETEYKWMMENSMDGENWYISMRGVYTKK